MQTRLVLRPGQRGTKRLVAKYGDQLVCVRYRYDAARRKRYTTVELIVAEADWVPPPPHPDTIVALRVALHERDQQQAIRAVGGTWDRDERVWKLRYSDALLLGLGDRIVNDEQ